MAGYAPGQSQFTGIQHKKRFSNYVKPKKQLFSTYEPINNFESRYTAIIKTLNSKLEETKKAKKTEVMQR